MYSPILLRIAPLINWFLRFLCHDNLIIRCSTIMWIFTEIFGEYLCFKVSVPKNFNINNLNYYVISRVYDLLTYLPFGFLVLRMLRGYQYHLHFPLQPNPGHRNQIDFQARRVSFYSHKWKHGCCHCHYLRCCCYHWEEEKIRRLLLNIYITDVA